VPNLDPASAYFPRKYRFRQRRRIDLIWRCRLAPGQTGEPPRRHEEGARGERRATRRRLERRRGGEAASQSKQTCRRSVGTAEEKEPLPGTAQETGAMRTVDGKPPRTRRVASPCQEAKENALNREGHHLVSGMLPNEGNFHFSRNRGP